MPARVHNKRTNNERFTITDLDRYLKTLSPEVKKLHDDAYLIFRDASDTLEEEFQVAALVVGVFQNRAVEWKSAKGGN